MEDRTQILQGASQVVQWFGVRHAGKHPESVRWTDRLLTRNRDWWSDELEPRDPAYQFLIADGMFARLPGRDQLAIMAVSKVVSVRGDLVEATSTPRRLPPGKMLAFIPDHSLSDGAATAATDGFFDVHNMPSWDTWVGFLAGPDRVDGSTGVKDLAILLSWIPESLIAVANVAIEVNPEQCIQWADELNRDELKGVQTAL